jgi:hypothetical protein
MSDVFEIKTITEKVTRYDPKTGVPYQATESKEQLVLFGKEIETPDEDYPSEWVPDVTGLEAFSTGDWADVYGKKGFHGYDYEQIIIGLQLGDSGSSRSSDEHIKEISDIEGTTAKVKKKLEALGYTGPVKIFLVHYVSC